VSCNPLPTCAVSAPVSWQRGRKSSGDLDTAILKGCSCCAVSRCSEDLPAAFTEEAATAKKGKGKVMGKGGKHGSGGKAGASGSGDAAASALEVDFAADKPKRKKKGDDDGPVETMTLEQRLAKEHVAALVHAGAFAGC
jgi:hypothetical protein